MIKVCRASLGWQPDQNLGILGAGDIHVSLFHLVSSAKRG